MPKNNTDTKNLNGETASNQKASKAFMDEVNKIEVPDIKTSERLNPTGCIPTVEALINACKAYANKKKGGKLLYYSQLTKLKHIVWQNNLVYVSQLYNTCTDLSEACKSDYPSFILIQRYLKTLASNLLPKSVSARSLALVKTPIWKTQSIKSKLKELQDWALASSSLHLPDYKQLLNS